MKVRTLIDFEEVMLDKDIELTIEGIQKDPDGNENKDITKETGKYYLKGQTHYVMTEDEVSAHSARYKFNHRFLEVVKNGDINSKMYFEAGKSYTSVYKTPYGRMELTFQTHQYTIYEKADTIEVSACYSLLNNNEIMSENHIKLSLTSKA